MSHPIYILAVLCLLTGLAEWGMQFKPLRTLGGALLVIILGAVASNTGLIPSGTSGSSIYSGVFQYIAPLAICWLMLDVNLRAVWKAGPTMISLFFLGSLATLAGVVLANYLLPGEAVMGKWYPVVAGMFTGTYIGGSVNLNAVALHYGANNEGELYAAINAADNVVGTTWIVLTLAGTKLLNRLMPRPKLKPGAAVHEMSGPDTYRLSHLAWLGLIGFAALGLSELSKIYLPKAPPILVLITFALALAQVPAIHRLQGSRTLGTFGLYLFLAVIGAYCDLGALLQEGRTAMFLLGFILILLIVHSTLIYGIAGLLRQDWDLVAVASQANIGGPSTAMAIAESLGRHDLVVPGLLAGALGYATGTYWGIWVVEMLR